jgi:hypothetical protein
MTFNDAILDGYAGTGNTVHPRLPDSRDRNLVGLAPPENAVHDFAIRTALDIEETTSVRVS